MAFLRLTQWAENHLSAILKATTQADFDEAFDAFVSEDVAVTLNGACISRDQLKRNWQGEKFDEASAIVTFNGAVEVPADKDQPIAAGVVGLFFEATIAENIIIRDTPAGSTVKSSLNITVVQDKSLQPPSTPSRGFFDGRRVSVLNQVVLDQPIPINLQATPA